MGHHLDLLRTIHMPLRSDGNTIRNSFGVVIATATDPITAEALVRLANLGIQDAKTENDQYQARESRLAKVAFGKRTD